MILFFTSHNLIVMSCSLCGASYKPPCRAGSLRHTTCKPPHSYRAGSLHHTTCKPPHSYRAGPYITLHANHPIYTGRVPTSHYMQTTPFIPGGSLHHTTCKPPHLYRAGSLHHTTSFSSFVQDHLVQAEYWHDPFNVKEYEQKCVFLPDINNVGSVRGDTQTVSVWMMVGLSELLCSVCSGEECYIQGKPDDD